MKQKFEALCSIAIMVIVVVGIVLMAYNLPFYEFVCFVILVGFSVALTGSLAACICFHRLYGDAYSKNLWILWVMWVIMSGSSMSAIVSSAVPITLGIIFIVFYIIFIYVGIDVGKNWVAQKKLKRL